MDVACSNSYINYNLVHPNDLKMFGLKTNVSTYLIGRYTSRSRRRSDGKAVFKRNYQYQFEEGNLPPEFWRRCEYCYKEGLHLKIYVKYTVCGIFFMFDEREKMI